MFVLPDGDGDTSYAFELARDIDKNIPVYVLPWPSPENKQPSSLEDMAKAIIPLIEKVKPTGPYGVIGYSSGGTLAIEITKQLMNGGYPVRFLGLIDTYADVEQLSETELFLESLCLKYPNCKLFNDSMWLDGIRKLPLNEAVEVIRKTNFDSHNIDIEWEALLTKQCHNYQNLCAAYKIDSLPMKLHLFKASEAMPEDILAKNEMCPKLGWGTLGVSADINIIPVDGNHSTMMTDPKNRSLLGEKLTKCLLYS